MCRSVLDLYTIGPGPSSSHTIGPMRAAKNFHDLVQKLPVADLKRSARLEARLFGSLAATGPGHGTDKAVLTGFLGYDAENCPANLPTDFYSLSDKERTIQLAGTPVLITRDCIVYDAVQHTYPYSNTLICRLLDAQGGVIAEKIYYSVGGGFVLWEGWKEPEYGEAPFQYTSAAELIRLAQENDLTIPQILYRNELAITGHSPAVFSERMEKIAESMRQAVLRGCNREGVLPGNLNVHRKAAIMAKKAERIHDDVDQFIAFLNAHAFAVSEENAAGGIVVTAPTCGSSGVVPAMLSIIERFLGLGPQAIRSGLLAAAAVGMLAYNNASIAGAEVGCQGEVGVASAMAAAMLTQVKGYGPDTVMNAAEIALEHHLGLTCDPIGGYVQIPCIERNAMGALKAYNASLMATLEDARFHRVGLDAAILAMKETGQDMNSKYKETSLGGLATVVTC